MNSRNSLGIPTFPKGRDGGEGVKDKSGKWEGTTGEEMEWQMDGWIMEVKRKE